MKKRCFLIAVSITVILALLCTSCDKDIDKPGVENTPGNNSSEIDRSFLYGINYVDIQMSDRVQVAQTAYLITALGAKSVRICVNCMETGSSFNESAKQRLHNLFSSLKLSGIEQIIFQIGPFPWEDDMGNKAPAPDDSDAGYIDFLNENQAMAALLAKEFSEITYWQLGNLFNYDRFLSPIGWKEEKSPVDPFTLEEKAKLTTDMMYHITKGIRSQKPNAVVIMPAMSDIEGLGGAAMVDYLDKIYSNIEGGNYGSSRIEDFFNALAWHPMTDKEPDQEWVDANNKIYAVAEKHGDGQRKVYLTEFGYDDAGDAMLSEQQSQWIQKAYQLVSDKLPYVESMHYYRLFNDKEERLGLMNEPREGFGPTAKGTSYQKMTGSQSDLSRFVIKEDQYSSGDNIALSVPTKASSSCEHPGWGWSLSGINNGTTEDGGWSNYYEMGEADWITSATGGGSNDYNKPEWVEFNLPFEWEINKVLIYTRNDVDQDFRQNMGVPRHTVVEISDDGESWTEVGELKIKQEDMKTYPEGTDYVDRSENPPFEISFDAVKTRNVRVMFKQLSTNWQHTEGQYFVQLLEIEIIMK